jgi:pyruvate, water dikinase
MSDQRLVCDLDQVGAGDRAVIGGKGASLGELCRAGIRVPPGFVVTAGAFECALRALDPDGSVRREIGRLSALDTAAIAEVTGRVRTRIAGAPLPGDLREQIAARYHGLSGGDPGPGEGGDSSLEEGDPGPGEGDTGPGEGDPGPGEGDTGPGEGEPEPREGGGVPVAVRSSATGEDGAETSFAGLQDTYLWVRGADAVIDHVRRCWASLYNAEAVGYRLRMKLDEQDLAMAVVVQRMVEPRCAGVMFTCSPVTGDRSVIAVEGCWGLGSALVSGEVTPDSFVVSKVTGEIVRRQVAAKLRMHRAGPGGTGVAAADVPGPLQQVACLRDAELAALARLGRQVEDHYGTPQDIEWAVTDGPSPEESVVLLQSRPETVWARRRAEAVATPKARAVDHVFEQLGRVNVVAPPSPPSRPPSPSSQAPAAPATRPER